MTLPPDTPDPQSDPADESVGEPVDAAAEPIEAASVSASSEGAASTSANGPAANAPAGGRWGRRITTGVLVGLAGLLFTVACVAVWAKRTVLDTDRVAAAVDAAMSDQAVIDGLALRLTDQIMTIIDNSGVIQQVLPTPLERLTPVIEAAIRNAVDKAVTDLVGSDAGRKLVVDAARVAHKTALRILEGKGVPDDSIFVVGNGVVKLDLITVIERVVTLLQEHGIISDSFDLQSVAASVTSNDKVQALATTFGVELPDDFGQITIYESSKVDKADEALASAQRALQVFQRLTVLLVILSVLAIIAALVVSSDKRRTAMQLAIVIGVLALIVRFAVDRVISGLNSTIEKAGARAAAVEMSESLTASLQRTALVIAICAFLIALIAFLIRPRPTGDRWLVTVVQRSPDIARGIVVGFCLLLLAVLGLSGAAIVVTVGLAIAGLLAVSALTKRAVTA